MASVCVVVTLAALLPTVLSAALLLAELAFGLVAAPVRYHQLDKKQHRGRSQPEHGEEDEHFWLQDGLRVLHQLLDPREGHAELLRSDGTSWFKGWWSDEVQPSQLGRSNVAQFLSYILFSGSQLGGKTSHLLHVMSDTFISAVGLDVGLAHNPDATFVSHTEQPLKVHYRPLMFYLLTELVAGITHLQLSRRMGFSIAAKSDIATYYIKHAPASAPAQPPLVFLHGIGLGLAPYTGFIQRLAAQHPDRTIVAVQYRHVSMRLTTHIPTATEVSDDVAAFLASAGFPRANVVAHSYGTLVASGLAKRHSSLLAGLTLIDPVCFAMFLPHLVVNTLHFDAKTTKASVSKAQAQPRSLWELLSVRRLMKGLVLREMHCAAAMSRRLRWPEVNLWTSEVPANTRVILGGTDNMIPVAEIHQMLMSSAAAARGIQVTYTPEHGHGAFLLHPELQESIVAGSSVAADSADLPAVPAAAAAAASAAAGLPVGAEDAVVAGAVSPIELEALRLRAAMGVPQQPAPHQRRTTVPQEVADRQLRKVLAGRAWTAGKGQALGVLAPLRRAMAASVACRRPQATSGPCRPKLGWML